VNAGASHADVQPSDEADDFASDVVDAADPRPKATRSA
jgi:hypothetical protein